MTEAFRPQHHRSPNVLRPVLGVLATLSTLPAGLYALQWYLNLDVNAAAPPTSPPQGPVQSLTSDDLEAIKQIPLDRFHGLKQDLEWFMASQNPNGGENVPLPPNKPDVDTPTPPPKQPTNPPPTNPLPTEPPPTPAEPSQTASSPPDTQTPQKTNSPTEPPPSATPVPPNDTDTPTPVSSATPTNSPTSTEPPPSPTEEASTETVVPPPTAPATNTPKPPNTLSPQELAVTKINHAINIISSEGVPYFSPAEHYDLSNHIVSSHGIVIPIGKDGFATVEEAQKMANYIDFILTNSATARTVVKNLHIAAIVTDDSELAARDAASTAQLFQVQKIKNSEFGPNGHVWIIKINRGHVYFTNPGIYNLPDGADGFMYAAIVHEIDNIRAYEKTFNPNTKKFGNPYLFKDEKPFQDELKDHMLGQVRDAFIFSTDFEINQQGSLQNELKRLKQKITKTTNSLAKRDFQLRLITLQQGINKTRTA